MNYGNHAEMIHNIQNHITGTWAFGYLVDNRVDGVDVEVMQYTGLKDKNGIDYVYEGDIVTEEGLVRGNIHEIQPRDSDIVIPRITSEDWQAAYKIAMDRGLIHA